MTVRVKEFRRALGLSQQALADAVGTSQQQIQRIEAGKATAKLDLALRIAEKLGAHLSLLFPDAAGVLDEAADFLEAERPIPDQLQEKLLGAGLDGHSACWTLVVRLRGHDESLELPLDPKALKSLWGWLQDSDEIAPNLGDFAVFDSGGYRFALNRREVVFHQFRLHLPREEISQEKFFEYELVAYFSGSSSALRIAVPRDSPPNEEGEGGQLADIFYLMANDVASDYRFPVCDGGGGYAFLRAGDLSLLVVPFGRLEGLSDDDDDEA